MSSPKASTLGFGCSPILGRTGRKQSLQALALAYDLGITLFDTARSYGYGQAEGLLGEFLTGKRDRVVICTKFGILPALQSGWKQAAKPIVRAVLGLIPSARAAVQTRIKSEFSEGNFTTETLRLSLEESLRQLRTDYVDILLMHSATVEALKNDELIANLEKIVKAGKATAIGISADAATIEYAIAKRLPFTAYQFPCNLFDLVAPSVADVEHGLRPALMINHPFGGASRAAQLREILQQAAAQTSIPLGLSKRLANPDSATVADAALNLLLDGNRINHIIAAMTNPHHIRKNVSAVTKSRFSPEELNSLRQVISAMKPANKKTPQT